MPDFVPPAAVTALRRRAAALDAAGLLCAAAIGRAEHRAVDAQLRGDRIRWLDEPAVDPAERALRAALEAVRLALNRQLALGLFALEAHYAIYAAGAGYAPHRDRFRDDDARVLSCVLYLNDAWRADDGGALRLHFDDGTTRDVLPAGGTLVAFLSERFVHEVRPAARERISITGWFRRRAGPGC